MSSNQVLESLSEFSNLRCESTVQKLEFDVECYIKTLSRGPEFLNAPSETPESDEFIYGKILQKLIQLFDESNSNQDSIAKILMKLVLIKSTFPMLNELFLALDDTLKIQSIRTADLISSLLEKIMKSESLTSGIVSICISDTRNPVQQAELEERWQKFLQILVSFPNKLANKLQGKIPDSFTSKSFTVLMSYHLIKSINFLNSLMKSNVRVNSIFISQMISKVLMAFGTENTGDLVKVIAKLSLDNQENIRSLIQKVIHKIDRTSIALFVILLLKSVKNPEEVELILGNVLIIPEWKYVLTNKIPLLSIYDDEKLIINLVSYLSIKYEILVDLLTRLLDIWGDKSALNHTSVNQHEYLTKLILISGVKLKESFKSSDKNSIKILLFAGISSHLQSLQVEIRVMGMMTGQLMVPLLNADDEPKLVFDYENMPESGKKMADNLEKFFQRGKEKSEESFSDPTADELIQDLEGKCLVLEDPDNDRIPKVAEVNQENKNNPKVVKSEVDSDDLDSDDDLVPYDMTSGERKAESFAPKYLRDLKENLINFDGQNKNVDVFVESIENAVQLILSQLPNDDASLAVELLRIFLTLDEKVCVDNFNQHKFNSCVAIVTIFPKECAKVLCDEFHAKIGNHSVSDRLFFLRVLAAAAHQLSKLGLKDEEKPMKKTVKPLRKPISVQIEIKEGKTQETLYDEDFDFDRVDDVGSCHWQEVIEKRLEMKTRYFAHQTKQSRTKKNKFNDSISYFFYPLVYGFTQKGSNLYQIPESYADQGNILLEQFLETLYSVVMAGENCVNIGRIAREMLELVWSLRFHEQARIRRCVLKNILAAIYVLKEGDSMEIAMDIMEELGDWLADVSRNSVTSDPDQKCRDFAGQLLALISC